jgi:hypothetical protein
MSTLHSHPETQTQIQLPLRTLSSFIASYRTTTNTSTSTASSTSSTTLYQPPTLKMHRRSNNTHVVKTTKPTLMTRLRGRNAKTRTVKTTTSIEPGAARTSRWGGNRRTAHTGHATHTTHAPVVRQRRHATIGDKISGAMMKIKGSLTRRPGVKVSKTTLDDSSA